MYLGRKDYVSNNSLEKAWMRMMKSRALRISSNLEANMQYSFEQRGSLNSTSYRIFFKQDETYISPVHDIPLW